MAELFHGKKLQRVQNGAFVDAGDAAKLLQGKKVGIYFSAHWCPPCRNFTPLLKKFYDEVNNGLSEKQFEIIFVSSDKSEAEQLQYMNEAHGDWLTLAFSDSFVKELKSKYGITGIPTFVIIQPNGEVITRDGRTDVMEGTQSFSQW